MLTSVAVLLLLLAFTLVPDPFVPCLFLLFRCIEYAEGARHPEDAGALIESIADKLRSAGMVEVRAMCRSIA